MSWWRHILNALRTQKSAPEIPLAAEEHLLEYAFDLVNRHDLINEQLDARRELDTLRDRYAKELGYARVYLQLERFLLANKPFVTKREYASVDELRRDIAAHISVPQLSLPVRVIFLPALEQLVALFRSVLPTVIAALRSDLGDKAVGDAIARASAGTVFEHLNVLGEEFQNGTFAELFKQRSQPELLHASRALFEELFNTIAHTLGRRSAETVAAKIYADVSRTYDQPIVSLFLDLMPDWLLISERLYVLSREELQKKVLEATQELHALNEQLEEKVRERTKELTEANAKLRELDRLKTEFVSIAAHQLRTPATKIKWLINVILEHPTLGQSEYAEKMRSVSRTVDQLIALVNDLLDVSRIEEGNWGIDISRQPYHEVVREICADAADTAAGKGLAFTCSVEENLPALDIDRSKMSIVLNNLVDNAIKYTEHGSVRVTVAREGERVVTSVEDSGIGISTADSERLFSKFFRADAARSLHTDGTGLGLFLTKRIIELHRGTIRFESTPGKGTTFTFTLPIPAPQTASSTAV